MILAAVVMAVGAALVANKWLQAKMLSGVDIKAGMVPVVAAAVQIPFGQKIELAHLRLLELPKNSVPTGAFENEDDVIGKIAAQTIFPGEVLLKGRVAEHLGGSTLAAVIEPGMRAVSVAVNEIIGVAGFLLPGNRVDVLATKKTGNRNVKARTLLQDIKVLAVDQTSSTDKNDPVIVRAVTLEVDPQQAEVLIRATQEGKVQLTLRNPLDEALVVAEQASPPQVKKPDAKTPVRKRVIYKPKVTVIRGTQVSTSEVRK